LRIKSLIRKTELLSYVFVQYCLKRFQFAGSLETWLFAATESKEPSLEFDEHWGSELASGYLLR
jgi:hypothetical protein